MTPSNYRQTSGHPDVGILKTKTVNLPVDERETLMAMNNQNQSRFHTANGYMKVRMVNRNNSIGEPIKRKNEP